MNELKVIAYLKPTCGWSQGVRTVLRRHALPFEDRNILDDPGQREEMVRKTGQTLSPCVEINGHMLADVSGDEVEAYLLANGMVRPVENAADAPVEQCCCHGTQESLPMSE